jgi:hypothetical protein
MTILQRCYCGFRDFTASLLWFSRLYTVVTTALASCVIPASEPESVLNSNHNTNKPQISHQSSGCMYFARATSASQQQIAGQARDDDMIASLLRLLPPPLLRFLRLHTIATSALTTRVIPASEPESVLNSNHNTNKSQISHQPSGCMYFALISSASQ